MRSIRLCMWPTSCFVFCILVLACACALQYNIFMMCCCSLPEIVNNLWAYANKHFTHKAVNTGRGKRIPSRETVLDYVYVGLSLSLFLSLPVLQFLFLLFLDVADINRIVAISISQHNKSFSIVFVFMQRQRKWWKRWRSNLLAMWE